MKVLRADNTGLCYGVRRATRLAEKILGDGPMVSLGPLIHNRQEVARLQELGLSPVDGTQLEAGQRALVRTHGISRAEEASVHAAGAELVDATCPYVIAARKKIIEFGRQGRTVVLVGDADHPEVVAQISYAESELIVVAKAADLPQLGSKIPIGLVAQTTMSRATFEQVRIRLAEGHADLVVSGTICKDAQARQALGAELASKVDAMLVVGGKHSANTRRLAEVCRAVQPRTYLVEDEEELAFLDLAELQIVGLTSGASTPDWLMDRVEHRLLDLA